MQKRTREILAVVLLALLLLAGIGTMAYYILIGHGWNVAASNIDDSIGQMEGYTVVLYKGTRQPVDDSKTAGKELLSENASADAALEEQSPDGSSEGEGVPEAEVAPETAPEQVDEAEPEQAPEVAPEPVAEPEAASVEDAAEAPGNENDSGSTNLASESGQSASSSSSSKAVREADVDAVAASYREKGANVFVVDVSDLSRYSEPFVVAKNGMRIGLFSVGKSTLRSDARANAHYLAEGSVNYTIALTNDTSLCNVAAEGLVGSISIIVCDDPRAVFPNGQYVGSTYCVSAPLVGEVGAVIVSPSGVLSTKTIIDGQAE